MRKKLVVPVRIGGQLTVFACLIYGIIVSLLVVMLESVFCQSSMTQANAVTNLSVQSLFSQYSRPLLNEYEIFGGVIYKDEEVLSHIYGDISANCKNNSSESFIKTFNPYGLKIVDINIEKKKMLTDNNGDFFYNEIVEFMKLGQLSGDNREFVQDMLEVMDKEDIEFIDKEIGKRQKEAKNIDEKILNLVNYVEGIRTTSTGFLSILGHKSCSGSFVKKLAVNGNGMSEVGISSSEVYKITEGKYYNILEHLEGLKGDLDWIKNVYFSPFTYGLFVDAGFKSNAASILSEVDNTIDKVDKSLKEIEEIEKDIERLMTNIEESKKVVKSKTEVKEEVINAYIEELDELKGYGDGTMYPICDVTAMKVDLLNKKSTLSQIHSSVGGLVYSGFDINSIDSMYASVDDCIEVCRDYDISTLQFNYEGINLGKGEKLSFINKITNYFKNSGTKLVLGEDAKVSKNKVNLSALSSVHLNYEKIKVNLFDPEVLYKDYLYNRYVKLWFSSYINPKEEGLLQYEMEYILGESSEDEKNLSSTINQLIGIRFVAAMSHLVCDTNRKKECLSMSTLLLGFSGVYGVIKLGQYALMSAWSYGEAINDVKILVEGGKVPFAKTDSNWKTQLLDIVDSKIQSNSGNESGLEYEDYLELLLFLKDRKTKLLRTMDAIEISMAAKGYEHIRMYNYLYSINGYATYSYRDKYEYSQIFSFSYE